MKSAAGFLLLVGMTLGYFVFPVQSESQTSNDQQDNLFVGQSLKDAMDVLNRRGIIYSEGGFDMIPSDLDRSNLYIQLDPNHSVACAYFSKSKSEITGLRMVFFPSRKQRSKAGESWVSATLIAFNEDRSYTVQFAPPITEEELKKLESAQPKSQLPPQLPTSR